MWSRFAGPFSRFTAVGCVLWRRSSGLCVGLGLVYVGRGECVCVCVCVLGGGGGGARVQFCGWVWNACPAAHKLQPSALVACTPLPALTGLTFSTLGGGG